MKRSSAMTLLAAATAVPISSYASGAELFTIKMATPNVDPGAEPYYAQEGGFFTAAGLRAEFQPMINGAAIAAAVVGGAIDIGTSQSAAVAEAHARSLPLVVLAPGAMYVANEPSSVLLVPKGSTVQSGAELARKTIASNGSLSDYCTRAYLENAGVPASDIKFIEMNFPQMVDALATSRVDAAVVSEPFVTAAKAVGRVIAAPFDVVSHRFLTSVYITTRSWADSHRDEVRRFQKVIFSTARWANANRPKTAQILAKYASLSPDTIRTMNRVRFAESWKDASAQPLIDLAVRYGGIAPFHFDELAYRA